MNNAFSQEEYNMIKNSFGKNAVQKEIIIHVTSQEFFEEIKHNIQNDRRGEVAFAVQRKNKKIIVIRTNSYPEGIYRIPTGGINYSENIIDALNREVKEELGLATQIDKFLGVIKYCFIYGNKRINFYSYVFWLIEIGGDILKDALEDEISEYMEVDKLQIVNVIEVLRSFQNKWKDWCIFRAYTTEFVAERM